LPHIFLPMIYLPDGRAGDPLVSYEHLVGKKMAG
jgi:hypothetical protein